MTTLDEKIKANTLPKYGGALSATLGAFALGTVLGWSSPTERNIHLALNDFSLGGTLTECDKSNTTLMDSLSDPPLAQVGWIGSVVALGAATVMLPLCFAIDRFGRKRMMLCLVIPFAVGWVIVCAATVLKSATEAIVVYCVGRYITGFCAGAFCVIVPIYIGEIAPKHMRGTLSVFFQLMLAIGILYTYIIGSFTSVLAVSIACGVIPLLFGAIFFFIPESPYFLLMKNKSDAAEKALQWFRGKSYDITNELEQMQHDISETEAGKSSLMEKLLKPAAKKSLMIGMGLMFCAQLSGIIAVIFHADAIFGKVGDKIPPSHGQIMIGVFQVLSTCVAAIVVDKLGRKLLLIISMGLMCVCHVAMGIYFIFADKDPESVASLSWLPVCFLCLFILAFSFGAGPIPWVMLGELFPSEIKGVGASLCSCVNWLLAFLVSFTFHFIVDGIGKGAPFMIFAVLCGLGLLFVVFFCIETKGKTLAEIQLILEGSSGSKGDKGEKGEKGETSPPVEKTA